MKTRINIIIFTLVLTSFLIIQTSVSEEKKGEDIIKGERVGGYVEKPSPKEAVRKEDVETWERWRREELKRRAEEVEPLEDRFKVLLEKWREKILPDRYIVTEIKGEALINLKKANVDDRISIRKDQITLRGYTTLELTDEKTKKIKIIIKQNAYQRIRFYLGDMNVPIKSMLVYYDPNTKVTTVEIELQQLTFEVVVYDGVVHTVIDMPVSRAPIVTTIPETEEEAPTPPIAPPPLPPEEPYEG